MAIACPSCGRSVELKGAKAGRFRIACPGCSAGIDLTIGEGPNPSVAATPVPVPVAPRPVAARTGGGVLSTRAKAIGSAVLVRLGWLWAYLTSRSARVGGTLIVEELGRTSRGRVDRGRQILVGRDVLVRILPARVIAADPPTRARGERVAYLAGRIVHPNLIRRLGSGEDRGRRYVVEEPVTGPSLAVLAGRDDWPGGPSAIPPVLQAARGLEAAHRQGLAHGELSAESIWLDGDVVKVLGLGLGETPAESRDGAGRFDLSASEDVRALGTVLEMLIGVGGTRHPLVIGMKAGGSPGGFPGLDRAIEAMEAAIGPTGPTPEEAGRLSACVASHDAAPLAKIRSRVILGGSIVCLTFAALFLATGRFAPAAVALGLWSLTAIAYPLVLATVGRGAGLFGRVREVVLGGSLGDRLTLIGIEAVAIAVLAALGWLVAAVALAVVAATLAVAVAVGLDDPIDRSRREAVASARQILRAIRGRGTSEVAIRELVRTSAAGRPDLIRDLVGDEAASVGGRGPIRRIIARWLDAKLEARAEASARARFEGLEEAALIAGRTNEMTARRKSRRIAEALVVIGREVRAASVEGLTPDGPEGPIRVVPRPIPDLIREAVETPDTVLTSTWSDDREPGGGPNPLLGVVSGLTGPRARFVVGLVLVAAFLLWAESVGVLSSSEIRERAREAIAGGDVGRLGEVGVDVGRAQLATEPLAIPGIPPALTRSIVGYGVGVAGLILAVSAVSARPVIAALALAGATTAWVGPRAGPISPAVASLVGLGLLGAGFLIPSRRSRSIRGTR